MNIAFFIVCMLVLVISTWSDLFTEKIPNAVVLPCILAGLVLQPFFIPFPDYLVRIGLICAVYFLYEGFIGAGDAKLVMMLIILGGPVKGLGALALSSALVLLIAALWQPYETRKMLSRDWQAVKARNLSSLKNEGTRVLLAPFLLVSFPALSLILGI